MRELGYVANGRGRSHGGSRSRFIGLLVYELGSSYINQLIRGIDNATADIGYDLILYTSHTERESEARHAAELASAPVDGLIITLGFEIATYVERLRRERIPFVLLDHDRDVPGATSVTAANRSGTKAAIDHLIELGHQRIGLITGHPDASPGRERIAGYRDALRDAGIAYDSKLVVKGDFLEPRGHTAMRELLTLAERPTAVFASSDMAAIGAIKAARAAGLDVPRDLSVVGFDDIPEAELVTPTLTTVRQPLQVMGATAVRLLRHLMDDPDALASRTELVTELIVRESTAPPIAARQTARAGT